MMVEQRERRVSSLVLAWFIGVTVSAQDADFEGMGVLTRFARRCSQASVLSVKGVATVDDGAEKRSARPIGVTLQRRKPAPVMAETHAVPRDAQGIVSAPAGADTFSAVETELALSQFVSSDASGVRFFFLLEPETVLRRLLKRVVLIGRDEVNGQPAICVELLYQKTARRLWFSAASPVVLLRERSLSAPPPKATGKEGVVGPMPPTVDISFSEWDFGDSAAGAQDMGANGLTDLLQAFGQTPGDGRKSSQIWTLPAGPEAYTEAKRLKEAAVWQTQAFLKAYETAGVHDDAWDEQANTLIARAVLRFRGNLDADFLLSLHEEACDLVDSGCTDPMIQYFHANFAQYVEADEAQSMVALQEAADQLEQSTYPRYVAYFAAARVARLAKKVEASDPQRVKDLYARVVRLLGQAVGDEMIADGGQREYARTINNQWNELKPADKIALLQVAEETPAGDPWAMLWLRGRVMYTKSTLISLKKRRTPEGRKEQAALRGEAQRLLAEAHELRPDFPEAATTLMRLELSHGTSRRGWFMKAVSAQFDYFPAYTRLYESLLSYSFFSPDAYEDGLLLGKACMDSGRFDTDVPLVLLKIRQRYSERFKDRRDAFRDPGLYDSLAPLFAALKEGRIVPEKRPLWLSIAAVMCWACEHYPEAATYREAVGDEFHSCACDYARVGQEEFECELAIATGKRGRAARDGLLRHNVGDPGAVPLLRQGMAENRDHADVWMFLAERTLAVGLREPFSGATAVAATLAEMGCLERLALEVGLLLERTPPESVPEDFRGVVEDALGGEALAYLLSQPAGSHRLADDIRAAAWEQVAATAAELGRDSAADPEMCDTQKALAELRLALRGDLEGRKSQQFVTERMQPSYTRIRHTGMTMDFIATRYQFLPNYYGLDGYRMMYFGHRYQHTTLGPPSRNKDQMEQLLAPLYATQDPEELVSLCWDVYREHGNGPLALELASLLRKRGNETAALLFERHVERFLVALTPPPTTRTGHSRAWPIQEGTKIYNSLPGYEEKVLASVTKTRGFYTWDTTYYLEADALLRLKRADDAAKALLASVNCHGDRDAFASPLGVFASVRDYRVALLRELLIARPPDPALVARLEQAFPEDCQAAVNGAGLEP